MASAVRGLRRRAGFGRPGVVVAPGARGLLPSFGHFAPVPRGPAGRLGWGLRLGPASGRVGRGGAGGAGPPAAFSGPGAPARVGRGAGVFTRAGWRAPAFRGPRLGGARGGAFRPGRFRGRPRGSRGHSGRVAGGQEGGPRWAGGPRGEPPGPSAPGSRIALALGPRPRGCGGATAWGAAWPFCEGPWWVGGAFWSGFSGRAGGLPWVKMGAAVPSRRGALFLVGWTAAAVSSLCGFSFVISHSHVRRGSENRSGGGRSAAVLAVEYQRHRSVVGELDVHVVLELAGRDLVRRVLGA